MEEDKKWYQQFLEGNQESFEKIVMKHKDRLIYFIQRYVKRIEIAEEIAQDVFVYLLLHKEKYNFQYSLTTYLYLIGKSKAITYLKREKRIVWMGEMDFQEIEELEEKVCQKERRENLLKDIKTLKQTYQMAIYLADFERLSYSEIAKILQKNLGQVKVLIYRARKSLEKQVRKEETKYEG